MDRTTFESGAFYDQKTHIADLVYQANQEFYDLFGLSIDKIIHGISQMLQDDRTELYDLRVLLVNGDLAGIVSFYSSQEIYLRQIFGLPYLVNDLVSDRQIFENFIEKVPNIREKSLYLARISVAKKHQSQGYAKVMLEYMQQAAIDGGYDMLSLHVHRDNKRAFKIYTDYGFSQVVDGDKEYYKLLKQV